jgi:hypothetical protein
VRKTDAEDLTVYYAFDRKCPEQMNPEIGNKSVGAMNG